jgi:predicted nuclease of restriction endonuclease-like (RecB) superfamily
MYYDKQNLSALLREMSWTHNLEIMKCKTDEEREFYIKMSKEHNWSYRLLQHNIDAHTFDRYKNQQTNFDKTLTKEEKQKAALTVKDDYNFDFLGRAEAYLEKELEDILIKNICSFLKELGGYFTFVDRQYRIEVDEKEFFVDLLFYNRELQSLVAIELKTGGFKPEYGSKMNFYLSALNDKVKLPHEKASIGIIICKSKNRTIVDYTLQDVKKPIGIATYNHYKTLKELPERISRYLPSEEELINRFEKVRK